MRLWGELLLVDPTAFALPVVEVEETVTGFTDSLSSSLEARAALSSPSFSLAAVMVS